MARNSGSKHHAIPLGKRAHVITKKGVEHIGKFLARNDRDFVIERPDGSPLRLEWRKIRSFGPYRPKGDELSVFTNPEDGDAVKVCGRTGNGAACDDCIECRHRFAVDSYRVAAAELQRHVLRADDAELKQMEQAQKLEQLRQAVIDLLEGSKPADCRSCSAPVRAVVQGGKRRRLHDHDGRLHQCP